ncbi:hypothetical protein AVEN_245262-1 [Araneus ventricosus]|uniref:Uncharacterized protein n=1 Tax=Araneus ventricosus TaxID=182803 RepID=A0A4Y2ECP2_ARAVE|nr:hypothetical protein AVEN_245262-1 [Araneus ventricosus]
MILADFLPQFYQGRVCKYASGTRGELSRNQEEEVPDAITATEPVECAMNSNLDRTLPHAPVPDAITATEPVEWAMDSNLDRTPPHVPVPDAMTASPI